MSDIEITYDGAYNVVVECTDCGTERGSSVVPGTTLGPSWAAYEHCETCGGHRDHEPVREAERGEYDGHLICDDCDEQFDNTMDVDLHDCPASGSDDDGDDGEAEVVADGGEDVTDHVDDETIQAAIEDHDGALDDDRTATVDEIRDALAWVQRSVTEHWSDWLSNVENNESNVVYEDHDVIVFATGEQNVPRRDLRDHYEDDLSERAPDVVSAIHHELARDLCDYDWAYEYPLVVRKPGGFVAGQEYVEAVVNGLQQHGLSPGQAWAYYGVEIRGESRNSWGHRKGDHDHKNVSDALEKAKKKLP